MKNQIEDAYSQCDSQEWKAECCGSCGYFLDKKNLCRKFSHDATEMDDSCPDFINRLSKMECTKCRGAIHGSRDPEELLQSVIDDHEWVISGDNLLCNACNLALRP